MNFKLRILALFLAILMCLTSCEFLNGLMNPGQGQEQTTASTEQTTTTEKPTTSTSTKEPEEEKFSRFDNSLTVAELTAKYTLKKDYYNETMTLLDTLLEVSKTAETIEEVDVIYDEFEERFYHIAQQMTIATIIYYCNTTDYKATKRHTDVTNMFYDLQDKYTTTCRSIYQESPYKDELFADWTEDEIQELLDYDPIIVELRKKIEELQVEYNALPEDEAWDDNVAEIYVQIVQTNQQIAAYYGYANYYDYAAANVYDRDYTREQLGGFREYIIKHIFPYVEDLKNGSYPASDMSKEDKDLANAFIGGAFDGMKENYLVDYLDSLEGTMGESMRDMFANKNCIFASGNNSHSSAFCTYLYEDETPFCLFGRNGQSSTTMVHEIGHYYADKVNSDLGNYDLLETHSQGNEFLFLDYCKDVLPSGVHYAAQQDQLFNMAITMMFSTIIDEFEQTIYTLESVEGFTSKEFDDIMIGICEKYGGEDRFGSLGLISPCTYWRYVCIDNPVYYISYAVSAVASLEIGALASVDREAAHAAYKILVEDVTPEDGFLGALELAGLGSPFAEETFIEIEAFLTKDNKSE